MPIISFCFLINDKLFFVLGFKFKIKFKKIYDSIVSLFVSIEKLKFRLLNIRVYYVSKMFCFTIFKNKKGGDDYKRYMWSDFYEGRL